MKARGVFVIAVCLLCTVAVLGFSAGKQEESKTEAPQQRLTRTKTTPTEYQEAPMLTEMVNRGELPPVEERLPDKPMVVQPWYQVGKYGGQVRLSMGFSHHLKEPPLMLNRDTTEVIPNVFEGWEYASDGTSLTFFLREGMRWSDGEPVTADDFMFWWEDVILNDEITPVKPQEFKPGGQLMDVEAVDDYTIVWQFQEPYWNAHYYWIDLWTRYGLPEHVLKDYHIDYNEKAQQMAEERNYDEWWQLFNQVAAMPGNGPEELNQLVPVLTPFKFAREIEGGWYVMERNPYYYQVDTDGNQLPYLDKLIGLPHWNVQDTEIIKAKTVAGELDWENWMGDISIFPILMKNAQQGKYQVWLTKQAYATQAGFYCNMNFTKDEVMGDILRDVRFRQALSLALNRDEMNETLYFGKGRPWQITCAPSAGYFRQEWAEAYADYDVNRANDLLDEMGLEWDANDEYRLRPDGDRLTMEVTVTTTHLPFYMPTTELAVEYWRELGIDANIKPADLSLAYEYASAGNHHVVVGYWQDATHQGLIKYRGDQLRGNWFLAQWAPQWFNYYQSDGEEGLEPPAWYMELLTTLDSIPYLRPDDAEKAAAKVWQIQADQLIGIGTVGHLPAPLMAANGLRNIPGEDYFSVGNVTTMGLRHQRTQEWFWAE